MIHLPVIDSEEKRDIIKSLYIGIIDNEVLIIPHKGITEGIGENNDAGKDKQ